MAGLSSKLRDIKRKYKRCRRDQSPATGVYEWLCDNYYLYEREGRWTVEAVKRINRYTLNDRGKRVEDICSDLIGSYNEMLSETFISRLKGEQLSVFEIDALPVLYRKVLLGMIYDSLFDDSEENRKRIGFATRALKNAATVDIYKLSEIICPLEDILAADPGGVYPEMTPETKAVYRRRIAILSRNEGMAESEYAQKKLDTARVENRHIGEYLNLEMYNTFRGKFFIALELILSLFGCLMTYIFTGSALFAGVAFLPYRAIAQKFFTRVAMNNVAPDPVLRIEKDNALVKEANVLIVISTLMPSGKERLAFEEHLKDIRCSLESTEHTKICVLADLKSANEPATLEDKERIEEFRSSIRKLNEENDGGFVGAVRHRTYSKTQRNFSGNERKRGAIEALANCLTEADIHEFALICGDTDGMENTDFFMVLDSDTDMPMNTIENLVSCAVHPVNAKRYGIFVPVAENKLPGNSHTLFSTLFSGCGGISSYNGLCSERYQDLFGKSIFAGKGLINVRRMHRMLDGAFPDETVLSHDILEGEVLHTKLVSDTCVAESFPSSQISFFKRQDRWVRGDFQNIVYIFSDLKNGIRLSGLSKYKLFDNIRRALTPKLQVLTLIVGGFVARSNPQFQLLISGLTAVIVFLSLCRPIEIFTVVQSAYTNLKAEKKAVFRRFISHRNMLEWVTAAGAEKNSDRKFVTNLKASFPSILVGALLCALPGFLKIYGIIFLLNPVFAYVTALPGKDIQEVGWTERDKLHEYAYATWQYYAKFAGRADNFLPPDNVQETPVFRIAHRTSPTNIGFLMLCTLSACDFGFIDPPEMYSRIENSLNTVERLEKYKGNLYNWYDTVTLNVLKPAYVSTVDSGNFLCMLTALKEGLKEYEGTDEHAISVRERIEKIIADTDIAFLYDKQSKLFKIGYNAAEGKFSESYYDLLMSEARMTGYYAVAKRMIPAEHWASLSRVMSKSGLHYGPLSWTGTSFEYFLPHILLPAYKGSLSEHSLRYCEYCQKKRVRGLGIPFGMSESGFYAFDRQLNYLYKAHGVQKLGLKRGLDRECVISPYSSFLLLPFDHKSALENLSALEQIDMMGGCGFYEAIDFTPKRTGGQDYSIVRSFMAHHVGMSMLSLSNAAFNDVMQKRFMSDTAMRGAKHLLMEKVPKHVSVFRDVAGRTEPKKPGAVHVASKRLATSGEVASSSRVYTNGEWTMPVFSNGMTESIYRGKNITVPVTNCHDCFAGVRIFFEDVTASEPKRRETSEIPNKTIFGNNTATFISNHKRLTLIHVLGVHPRLPGEIHSVTIKNSGIETAKVKLYIWANPFLTDKKEGMSHPAFTKIFMKDRICPDESYAVINRNSGKDDSLSMACGLLHEDDVRITTSNIEFFQGEFKTFDSDALGVGVPDPCAAFEITLTIKPGKSETSVFFMCAGGDDEEAVSTLTAARNEYEKTQGELSFAPELFPDEGLERLVCSELLPGVLCPSVLDGELSESIKCNVQNREILWKFGVSGDRPVVCMVVEKESDTETAAVYMRIVSMLCLHGIYIDLVLCCDEGGNYEAPIRHAIESLIQTEGEIIADRVFCLDMASCNKDDLTSLKAASDKVITKSIQKEKEIRFVKFESVYTVPRKNPGKASEGLYPGFEGEEFRVLSAPALPWCLCLANDNFGTLVSENSLGFSWAFNSRENKLTAHNGFSWQRDNSERILIKFNDKFYDLLKGSSAVYKPDRAEYIGRIEKCIFRVTVFVPKRGMTKRICIDIKNTDSDSAEFKIGYYTEPVLGVSRSLSKFLTCEIHKNGITVTNESLWGIKGYAFVGIANSGIDFWSCNALQVLSGNFDDGSLMPCAENCVFVGKNMDIGAKDTGSITFSLSFAKSENAAVFLGSDFDARPPKIRRAFCVDTGDKALDVMINTWLPMQMKNSRMFGRCGFYQSGGAFGFRDQLQDAMNISLTDPDLAKQFVIRCASVQFPEGDVLHWWHNFEKQDGGIRGIRTMCSDDMLWLPLALSKLVRERGDKKLLSIKVAFLSGEELKENEVERYARYDRGDKRFSLYEHGKRAISRALNYGEHGLLKMGSCDWNDGFSMVGREGRGESVWLSMFAAIVTESYAELADYLGDSDYSHKLTEISRRLKQAVDENAWNGEYYIRAFFDDGTPMDRIDSLPQSFAMMCRMPISARVSKALQSSLYRLYDKEHGVVRLFWPPLTPEDKIAGYVNFYSPGTRENGGQYTHAAVWLAFALFRSGNPDTAYEILSTLNPANKFSSNETASVYLGEPFAMAGDVYTVEPYCGRAGWTQYTGAAGWFYRTVIEEMLGIKLKYGKLSVSPDLPSSIAGFSARFDDGEKIHEIKASK